MTLSLDTNVAVDLLRRRETQVRERFGDALASGEPVVLSAVALYELAHGVRRSDRPDVEVRALDALLADLTVVDFDASDALVAGSVRHQLETPGLPVGVADMLIAGQAVNRGWTVVTHDVAHFGRVQGLTLIDWRVSDRPLSYLDVLARLPRTLKDK